jgi:hypothetical protein
MVASQEGLVSVSKCTYTGWSHAKTKHLSNAPRIYLTEVYELGIGVVPVLKRDVGV